MESDRAYYARRAEEQRRAAERAADPETRRLHLDLAALMEARERAVRRRPSRP